VGYARTQGRQVATAQQARLMLGISLSHPF
jgi:hypothetical protein